MKYDVAPLFPLPDGTPSSKQLPMAKLFRWTFDFDGHGNTMREEQLDDRSGEFPRFDERFCTMNDYRHGWIVAGDITNPKTGEPRQDGLVHYDLKSGKSTGSSRWTRGIAPVLEHGPSLVILDIGLPELDGWQVLERVRELADVPVLILTAPPTSSTRSGGCAGAPTTT